MTFRRYDNKAALEARLDQVKEKTQLVDAKLEEGIAPDDVDLVYIGSVYGAARIYCNYGERGVSESLTHALEEYCDLIRTNFDNHGFININNNGGYNTESSIPVN